MTRLSKQHLSNSKTHARTLVIEFRDINRKSRWFSPTNFLDNGPRASACFDRRSFNRRAWTSVVAGILFRGSLRRSSSISAFCSVALYAFSEMNHRLPAPDVGGRSSLLSRELIHCSRESAAPANFAVIMWP